MTPADSSDRPIRVAALSHRRISRVVWCSGAFEAEDVLAGITGASVIAPMPIARGEGPRVRFVRRLLRRSAGVSFVLEPRVDPSPLREKYDLFVFYAQNVRDFALLEAVPNWREQCRRAVCWIEELWPTDFERTRWQRLIGRFDFVATHFWHTLADLQRLTRASCEWLPAAVDALRFCPTDLAAPRPIDVFALGRRSEAAHRELLQLAEARRWTYLFDTLRTHEAHDVLAHRVQMAALIRRTRWFLVCPAKMDAPAETGGREELGLRFFEGAAGGAALVGAAPRSPAFERCFPWLDAVIPLPWDAPGISEILLELDRDPARMRAIRRANVVHCLRRHDWAHRWQQILRRVELPEPPALRERLERLAELARQLEAEAPAGVRV